MARYTDESKERLREAVDMVELVSARTELRRAGASWVGLCPFHDERTPSFSVEPVKKLFHCFGCDESGDVFDFVRKTEGVDFTTGLELLADRTGVQLEREAEDPREAERRQRRERLLELLDRTASYYERVLWEAREAAGARAYLAERGLGEQVLRRFRVGYAPDAWDRVLRASQGQGFSVRELGEAGLVQRSRDEGRVFDRFRRRVMFPLADPRGRVRGFGARALREGDRPKYLNTAEGELFHKGRQLYAADLARAAAARSGAVVLCEGYTDVLALHQAGLANAVATMGTALTVEQVGELRKLARVVHLALDADAAGQRAMLRAAEVAAGADLELRVVALPDGLDPADLVRERGADAMRALVERSVPFVRFRVERALAAGDLSHAEGKDRVLEELRPVFATLGPSVLREELLRLVADRLDVPGELAAGLLGAPQRGAGPSGPGARARVDGARGGRAADGAAGGSAAGPAQRAANGAPGASARQGRPRVDGRVATERAFLALCLALPEPGRETLAAFDPDEQLTDERSRAAARWLRDHLEAPLEGLGAEDEEVGALVHELVVRAAQLPADPAALEAEGLRLQIARLDRRIAAADGSVAQLAAERAQLKVRLDQAVGRALGE